jgi:two-component system response regulator FixJ
MARDKVLIVSEDSAVRDSVSELVATAGLDAEVIGSMEAWIGFPDPIPRGCLILDAGVGELGDPERRKTFAAVCARVPVLVLTERGDVPTAVQAIKLGAVDVLQKPYRGESLLACVAKVVAGTVERDATV